MRCVIERVLPKAAALRRRAALGSTLDGEDSWSMLTDAAILTCRRSHTRHAWRIRTPAGDDSTARKLQAQASHEAKLPPPSLGPGQTIPWRACIVSTMAYNSASLDSFICYYLYLGFQTLYLYLDDPNDETVHIAKCYDPERVKVRVRDSTLAREWEAMPSWPRLRLYAEREVQARQMLNCEHAIARCRVTGEDWLLHVDSDELLYLPSCLAELRESSSPSVAAATQRSSLSADEAPVAEAPAGRALQSHLEELDRLGLVLFTYRNLESVPEELECDDMYREVSLFKQHPSLLEPRHADPDVRRACDYWYGAGDAGGELFRFYANGKSIIRVHEAMRECGSVHEWSVPSKQFAASATGTNNAALRHSQYVYHQLMRLEEMGGAVLLHYACCSFGTFWQKRWAELGYASPNHRFRGGGGGLDQRANALALADRRDEAEAFYRRSLMVCDPAEKRRQLQAGVCMRMPAAEIVAAARATLLPRSTASGTDRAAVNRNGVPASHTPLPASTHPSQESGAAVVTPIGTGVGGAPDWLDASSLAAVDAARRLTRDRALDPVTADRAIAQLAGQAIDEAERLAHMMAAEAVKSSWTAAVAARLTERGLPTRRALSTAADAGQTGLGGDGGDGGDGPYYADVFVAVLPRAARSVLHLLPLDRLRFDLAAYWAHPMARALLTSEHVESLLHTGCVLLRSAFPEAMIRQLGLECATLLGPQDLSASTAWAHERSAWVLSPDEAPARSPAPEPPRLVGLPDDLYGRAAEVSPSKQPALCGALRGLRGVAAALEEISELRLATPRGGVLREVLRGGVHAHGPLNSGWPDSGCEVVCTLIAFPAGGAGIASPSASQRTLTASSHGKLRTLSVAPGDILLTLARQTRLDVSASDGAPDSLWLTLPFYSSQLRSVLDGRLLGVSQQAIKEMREMRNRGELRAQVEKA